MTKRNNPSEKNQHTFPRMCADFYDRFKEKSPAVLDMMFILIVQSAIGTLSATELEAVLLIFREMRGNECTLVASKIADRAGITRSVIVNALRKFESAGVIESRSSGMKGTSIKVLNDCVFEELEQVQNHKTSMKSIKKY